MPTASVYRVFIMRILLPQPQVCAGIDTLDAELGEDILCGEPNVTDLWSVRTVEEAVGKFG